MVEEMESQVTNLYRRAVLQPRSSCVREWLVEIRDGVVDHG